MTPHLLYHLNIQLIIYTSNTEEREVNVAASEAWKLYGSLQLSQLVLKALPGIFTRIKIVRGDGGAGTILHISFNPGAKGGLKSCKEEFTVVDDGRRVKVSEVLEGGWLELGFTHIRVKLEVIEKEGKRNECITRTTIEYEFEEEDAAILTAHVSIGPFTAIMQVAADYVHSNSNGDYYLPEKDART